MLDLITWLFEFQFEFDSKNGFFAITDLISLKKHLDQGFGKEKQSSGTGRKEDGQEKEGTPTKKGSRQNAFISTKILLMNVHQNNLLRRVFLSAKSVKTDQ